MAMLEPVEVERYSQHSVWISGRRYQRKGVESAYFPTREEAYTFVDDHLKKKAERLVSQLSRAVDRQVEFSKEYGNDS